MVTNSSFQLGLEEETHPELLGKVATFDSPRATWDIIARKCDIALRLRRVGHPQMGVGRGEHFLSVAREIGIPRRLKSSIGLTGPRTPGCSESPVVDAIVRLPINQMEGALEVGNRWSASDVRAIWIGPDPEASTGVTAIAKNPSIRVLIAEEHPIRGGVVRRDHRGRKARVGRDH
jgi:hypothetical protein